MDRRLILAAAAAASFLPSYGFAAVTATVSGTGAKPISPLIYGSNQNTIASTNDRLGGNRWTAYNWETNASNAGSDYQYQNDGYLGGGSTPGGAVSPTLRIAASSSRLPSRVGRTVRSRLPIRPRSTTRHAPPAAGSSPAPVAM